MVRVSGPGRPWETSHQPFQPLFAASAVKCFILCKFLQDVEEGRLSEDDEEAVNDGVRALGSPVFGNLTGTVPARSALEAMIAHSDNTGTDIALKRVGPDRVRAFLASAGYETVKIPTSTRRLVSYLNGAPRGVDVGWKGMLEFQDGKLFGPPRSPMNDVETMQGSAAEFVAFYERALDGRYFRKPETLTEFKRILAMANVLPLIAPPDTPAYGKGGSLDSNGYNALIAAGQMRAGGGKVPVSFCFTINYPGDPAPQVMEVLGAAAKGSLGAIAEALG
jgi:beta-lactamase class A